MGLRYLFLGLALWGFYLIIRHLIRQKKMQHRRPTNTKAVDSVQCAHCGLHLPREEAISHGQNYYCSKAHLLADNPDRDA
ncbi:MAG: hypothetical protein KZQ93_02660 [Candidatus Thiodiazotropha sp. (ex Monitilora ramsayi)]|nr:hypothetical protein [Candidatus Thiodiazotropha sp. (ex Monitilora ramsayi)]